MTEMGSIGENIQLIKDQLPANVRLVAVSKTQPVSRIQEAYNAAQLDFGENKVQELVDKNPQLPQDIRWHFIGHLQRNKVKQIAPFVGLIHGIDSFRLLREVNKQGARIPRKINCLLQFHIARETSKFGLDLPEAIEMLSSPEFKEMKHVQLCGVMGMATFTDNMEQVAAEFQHLSDIFEKIKAKFFKDDPSFREKSMGMTNDYLVAIAHGSTMVRIGSAIFGERIYS
jgi:PLP dependent protein